MDAHLLELLCCPAEWQGKPCHGPLVEAPEGLECQQCGLVYPIEEGIPVMLPDHATPKEHS